MQEKICQICGESSGVYPLCKKHAELKEDGYVIKNEEGQWAEVEASIKLRSDLNEETQTPNCLICGQPSNGRLLCFECYGDSMQLKDSFNKNLNIFDLRDYYYTIKANIIRIINFDTVKTNCKRLFALAYLTSSIHKDSSLVDRVQTDVTSIIKLKNSKKELIINERTEKSDSQKEMIFRTLDGHIVKRNGDIIIDDILFELRQIHCYEKEVVEIPYDKVTIKSNFFIPVNANKGIYIEYFGIENPMWQKKNEERIKLFNEYNAELIVVEKGEIDDKTVLSTRLQREIKEKTKRILKNN